MDPATNAPAAHDPPDAVHEKLVARLKLRQLALLERVAKHRTLSRVAQEMRLTQPAITQSLREIEDLFGAPLFTRGSRGLAPTLAGELALAHARSVLAGAEATARGLAAIREGRRGRLRIGVIPHLPAALLDALLGALVSASPRIALMLREGTTDELVADLRNGDLDCAVGRLSHEGEDGEIVHVPLYEQRPSLLVPARSRARLARGPLHLGRLAALDWVLPPPRTPIRRTVNAMFVSAGVPAPTPMLETWSLKSIELVLAREPNAIALLTQDAGAELAARGVVARLPCELHWNLPPIGLLSLRQTAAATLPAEAFEALKAAAAKIATAG